MKLECKRIVYFVWNAIITQILRFHSHIRLLVSWPSCTYYFTVYGPLLVLEFQQDFQLPTVIDSFSVKNRNADLIEWRTKLFNYTRCTLAHRLTNKINKNKSEALNETNSLSIRYASHQAMSSTHSYTDDDRPIRSSILQLNISRWASQPTNRRLLNIFFSPFDSVSKRMQ